MAKKRESVTGKKKRKSARCSRRRRRSFGARGVVRVWMWREMRSSKLAMWRSNGGVGGLGGGSPPIALAIH